MKLKPSGAYSMVKISWIGGRVWGCVGGAKHKAQGSTYSFFSVSHGDGNVCVEY